MAPKTKRSYWREEVRRLTNDNLAGQILWLPAADKIPSHLDPGLDKGCYNHPVVVMSKKPLEDDTVTIFMMTSFQGKDFNTGHTANWVWRHHYYPIAPSPAHPESGVQLRLADGYPNLRKNSYVSVRDGPYAVNLGALYPYRPLGTVPPVLSKKSFRVLSEAAQKQEEMKKLVPEKMKGETKWKKKRSAGLGVSSTTVAQQQPVLLGRLPSWLFYILGLVVVVSAVVFMYNYIGLVVVASAAVFIYKYAL